MGWHFERKMGNKHFCDNGELEDSKNGQYSKQIKDYVQEDSDLANDGNDGNDNDRNDKKLGEKLHQSLDIKSLKPQRKVRARPLNASKKLKTGDVGLMFQLKMNS